MAREYIERTWCDPCLNADGGPEYTEAKEVTIAVGAAKARVLAVCERHEKELVAPVVHALNEYGVQVDKIKAKPGKVTNDDGPIACKYPGCDAESATRGGFAQHLRMYHNIGVVVYEQIVSGEKTLKELGLSRYKKPEIPETLVCKVGGCARDFSGPRRKNSLGAHMAKSHPDEWLAMNKKLDI